jgi:hypothetical protein
MPRPLPIPVRFPRLRPRLPNLCLSLSSSRLRRFTYSIASGCVRQAAAPRKERLPLSPLKLRNRIDPSFCSMETKMRTKILALTAVAVLVVAGAVWAYQGPAAADNCCVAGASCCFLGSPCCETGDCCAAGIPCCPDGACCQTAQAGADCCALGLECCFPGSACCNPACCTAGSPCCPDGACCAGASR